MCILQNGHHKKLTSVIYIFFICDENFQDLLSAVFKYKLQFSTQILKNLFSSHFNSFNNFVFNDITATYFLCTA